MKKHMLALVALGCMLIASSAHGVSGRPSRDLSRPGFDPNEVVHRIRGARSAGAVPSGSGEFLVDTSRTFVPAPDYQMSPALAYDGANFLVVWSDERSAHGEIMAARVTPSGRVLDSLGILVSPGINQFRPAVAFDGANFLVVCDGQRAGVTGIYGTRVSPSGEVLDPDGIAITRSGNSPALAFDGTNFLIAWEDGRNHIDEDIYGARVTPAGSVLDPDGIPISLAGWSQRSPAVAFDGSEFLVTWDDGRNDPNSAIYGARVTPSGSVLDPNGIEISDTAAYVFESDVASDGVNFLVVWVQYLIESPEIFGIRVTPGGAVLAPNYIRISTAVQGAEYPSLIFDGANYLVSWQTYEDSSRYGIVAARVTPSGAVVDTNGIEILKPESVRWYPALAFDGANTLVVWQGVEGYGLDDIYGARVSRSGSVLDTNGTLVTMGVNRQERPDVAFDGDNFLVVWQDLRSDGISFDIYGARVTPAGELLDPGGLAISQAIGNQVEPRLAFDGTNFLVVWEDGRKRTEYDVYGARVTPSGNVLDPDGIPICSAADWQYYPDLAFDGTDFLVAWSDYRNGDSSDIYGARVTTSGEVLDPGGVPISLASGGQGNPALVFDGTNFMVVWQDYHVNAHGMIRSTTQGARVTPAGRVLDTVAIHVSHAPTHFQHPAIAFGGSNSLILWSEPDRVYGARVSPSGEVLDTAGIVVARSPGGAWSPSIAFDGSSYMIVWEDGRYDTLGDVFGARMTPGGVVIDSGAVVKQADEQSGPRLAAARGGRVILTYQSWADTVGGRIYDIPRIWGKVDPIFSIEEPAGPVSGRINGYAGPTIVRGVLTIAGSSQKAGGSGGIVLLDASGRKVLKLKPGPNDVSRLASGVYFLANQGAGAGRHGEAPTKVVIAK